MNAGDNTCWLFLFGLLKTMHLCHTEVVFAQITKLKKSTDKWIFVRTLTLILRATHDPYNVGRGNVLIDDCEFLFVWGGLTWKLFISLHPSDGGSRLTAHGGAGHLCLVALAQHLIPGLNDGVTWRNYDRTHKQNLVNTEGIKCLYNQSATWWEEDRADMKNNVF